MQQGNLHTSSFQQYGALSSNQNKEAIPPEEEKKETPTAKRPRGFAAMSPEKQREIASQGGKAAHKKGTAHQFTTDEARLAGQKGGEAVSRNRQHMSEIGRKGGERRSQRSNNLEQDDNQAPDTVPTEESSS